MPDSTNGGYSVAEAKALQQEMINAGVPLSGGVDGWWGPESKAALLRYRAKQKDEILPVASTIPGQIPVARTYNNSGDLASPYVAPDSTIPAEDPILTAQKNADALTQKFYQIYEKPPVFDAAKADRLRRMGRINMLGRNISVLGDVFGTALGANVRRRQPDQVAPALYQSYDKMKDRYDQEQKAYLNRDFQTQRQNTQLGIHRADITTQFAMAQQKQKDWIKAKEADNKLVWSKWSAQYKLDQDKLEISKQNAESNRIRVNKVGATKEPKKVQTKNAVYEMSQAEYSQRRERALKNSDLLKTRFADMFVHTPKLNKYNKVIPGQFVTTLNPKIKDDDLVRADLELEEQTKAEKPSNASSKVMLTNPGMTNTAPKNSYSSMPY